MASAVPHPPAPMTAILFILFYKTRFSPVEQSLDIRAMSPDREQRGDDGKIKERPARFEAEKEARDDDHRQRDGRADRRQRHIARAVKNNHPYCQRERRRNRHHSDQHTRRSRDSLSSFERKPHRKIMPDNAAERGHDSRR